MAFFVLSSCTTFHSSTESHEPKEFFVSVGHPWSGQKLLRWENDHLLMRLNGVESGSKSPIEKVFRPPLDRWGHFWDRMDAIGVWNWRSNYEPDGTVIETEAPVWKVALRRADKKKKVDAIGRSIFPPDEKLIWQSAGYQSLCKAIAELISEEFC